MDLEVQRDDLATTRFYDGGVPEVGDGQVLLRVDAFSLTSNNITYGVFGDAMRYWDFFPPSSEGGWGRIPAFGFGEVVASEHPEVEPGVRVYGYFPMSEHLVVSPERVDGRGFFDGAAHRRPMASAYNHYLRTDADASYDPEREAQQMLLRPLFFTSYLIEDLLADNEDFGASTIVLSSASSKTAIGTAFQLRARSGIEVVGLTSAGNRAFVEELDLYDRVLSYDEVGELATTPSAYVDVAGMGPLREAIHAHLGDALTHDMIVGATHRDEGGGGGDLPGPTPTMFFAPSQVAKRAKEWGQAGFDERLGSAWTSFSRWTDGWLEVRRGAGPEAVEDAYRTVLEGGLDPRVGTVVSMGPAS